MGRPIVHEYDQSKTILKFFDYKAAKCVVPELGVNADANGNNIVQSRTPLPPNDSSGKGYLLQDVDVTNGDAPGAYIYEGSINNAKLKASGITVSAEAKTATPRVTFFD